MWTIRSLTAILAMWTRLAGGIALLLVLAPQRATLEEVFLTFTDGVSRSESLT